MGAILAQLNAVPGVVGSLVSDAQGNLLAHEFPPGFDVARLRVAASVISDRAAGLDAAVGTVGTIDLRYAMARVVIRPIADGRLLFLCTPAANLQTLLLSTSGAVRRLESLLAGGDAAAKSEVAAPAPVPTGALHKLVQDIDAAITRSGADRYKLRGRIALMAGFALDLVDPESPDDAGKLQKLKTAASVVLGRPF